MYYIYFYFFVFTSRCFSRLFCFIVFSFIVNSSCTLLAELLPEQFELRTFLCIRHWNIIQLYIIYVKKCPQFSNVNVGLVLISYQNYFVFRTESERNKRDIEKRWRYSTTHQDRWASIQIYLSFSLKSSSNCNCGSVIRADLNLCCTDMNVSCNKLQL